MPYFVLALGIIMVFYGGYLIKKENKENVEVFQGLVEEQGRDKDEFIKLMAANEDLKVHLYHLESQLDHISAQLEQVEEDKAAQYQTDKPIGPDYWAAADKIAEMKRSNMSLDQIAASLNMGKGEVLLIQNLLEKQNNS